MESAVNQSLDPGVKQQLITHSKGWRGINNPWMADGDDSEEFQYINLVVNPERYTGYKVRRCCCRALDALLTICTPPSACPRFMWQAGSQS